MADASSLPLLLVKQATLFYIKSERVHTVVLGLPALMPVITAKGDRIL